MKILRTVANIASRNVEESRRFYENTLGYRVVMDLDWIVTLVSATEPTAQLSLIAHDPSGVHPAVSIEVDDVDAVYDELTKQGLEVIYDLRDEPWGVRRFFVRDPNGTVINILAHTHSP
jgi:catechol 2,3-dioxygenase-like lactoylglutathione lyase family enzyme